MQPSRAQPLPGSDSLAQAKSNMSADTSPQPTPSDHERTTVASDDAASQPGSFWARLRAYRLLWILGLSVFGLDQITKTWIAQTLPFNTYGWPGQIVVIENFFNIVHVGNTGAAWSLFAGKSFFLAILAAITLGGIYLWRHQLGLRSRVAQVGFGLLCGGIVGNLVDRLLHGHVIDFLDFHFGGYVYPTFNVADMGICIGVGIYVIHSFLQPESKPQKPLPSTTAPVPAETDPKS